MNLNPSEGLALFTDGSSNYKDGSGGWAWCAIDAFDGQEIGSGGEEDTTNNRMELQAWIEGLNSLYSACGPCYILVYSDSEYVGLGAMDRERKRNKNIDLWIGLDAAIDQHETVEFWWVKGHEDSHFNNLVDELARNARQSYVRSKDIG